MTTEMSERDAALRENQRLAREGVLGRAREPAPDGDHAVNVLEQEARRLVDRLAMAKERVKEQEADVAVLQAKLDTIEAALAKLRA